MSEQNERSGQETDAAPRSPTSPLALPPNNTPPGTAIQPLDLESLTPANRSPTRDPFVGTTRTQPNLHQPRPTGRPAPRPLQPPQPVSWQQQQLVDMTQEEFDSYQEATLRIGGIGMARRPRSPSPPFLPDRGFRQQHPLRPTMPTSTQNVPAEQSLPPKASKTVTMKNMQKPVARQAPPAKEQSKKDIQKPSTSQTPQPKPEPKENTKKPATSHTTVAGNNPEKNVTEPAPAPPAAKSKPATSNQNQPATTTRQQSTQREKILAMSLGQRLEKVPRRGVAFPDTGFRPSGEREKSGHYSKSKIIGKPPKGCDLQEWLRKIRSAESVLSKQLLDPDTFRKFCDEGWVHDRALYLWKKEKKRKGEEVEEEEEEETEEGDDDDDTEMKDAEGKKDDEEMEDA
jgi:hypothetical protein